MPCSERMKYAEKVIDRDRQTDRQTDMQEAGSEFYSGNPRTTRAAVRHTAKSSILQRIAKRVAP